MTDTPETGPQPLDRDGAEALLRDAQARRGLVEAMAAQKHEANLDAMSFEEQVRWVMANVQGGAAPPGPERLLRWLAGQPAGELSDEVLDTLLAQDGATEDLRALLAQSDPPVTLEEVDQDGRRRVLRHLHGLVLARQAGGGGAPRHMDREDAEMLLRDEAERRRLVEALAAQNAEVDLDAMAFESQVAWVVANVRTG